MIPLGGLRIGDRSPAGIVKLEIDHLLPEWEQVTLKRMGAVQWQKCFSAKHQPG